MKMLYDSTDIYSANASEPPRMSRHKRTSSDAQTSSSSHTLSSAVSRFISSVNGMNETIMVPSRLLDMEMNDNNTSTSVPELLQGVQDPYVVYGLLNSTKNDLMFGLSPTTEEDEESIKKSQNSSSDRWSSPTSDSVSQASSIVSSNSNSKSISNNSNSSRKISSLSLMSLGSSTGSCDSGGECDIAEEASEDSESCLSSEESTVSTVAQATAELRQHMSGLYSCLNQLSDTALYITDRYQDELAHGI